MDEKEFEEYLKVLKRTHERVYIATMNEDTYVFRPLTQKEYEEILSWGRLPDELEEDVCAAAVLYPTRITWAEHKAGVAPFLHQQIITVSGFTGPQQVAEYLEQARTRMQSFYEQAINMIASAFPQYTFEDIESWHMEKIMKFAARAEWSLDNVKGRPLKLMIGSVLQDGEEEQEPEPEPTLAEIGQQMREQGVDPMMEIGPKPKPPYVEFPLIGGGKVWENEEVFGLVRQHVQRRLESATVLSEISEE